jgi:hypothetical protein
VKQYRLRENYTTYQMQFTLSPDSFKTGTSYMASTDHVTVSATHAAAVQGYQTSFEIGSLLTKLQNIVTRNTEHAATARVYTGTGKQSTSRAN